MLGASLALGLLFRAHQELHVLADVGVEVHSLVSGLLIFRSILLGQELILSRLLLRNLLSLSRCSPRLVPCACFILAGLVEVERQHQIVWILVQFACWSALVAEMI